MHTWFVLGLLNSMAFVLSLCCSGVAYGSRAGCIFYLHAHLLQCKVKSDCGGVVELVGWCHLSKVDD